MYSLQGEPTDAISRNCKVGLSVVLGNKRRQSDAISLRARVKEGVLRERRNSERFRSGIDAGVDLTTVANVMSTNILHGIRMLTNILQTHASPPSLNEQVCESIANSGLCNSLSEALCIDDIHASEALLCVHELSRCQVSSNVLLPLTSSSLISFIKSGGQNQLLAFDVLAGLVKNAATHLVNVLIKDYYLQSLLLTMAIRQSDCQVPAISIIRRMSTIGEYCSDLGLVEMVLPVLNNLLFEGTDNVLVEVCWALVHIADSGPSTISMLVKFSERSIIRKLADLLASSNVKTIIPVIRIFGNIATGTSEDVDQIIALDILPMFCYLLSHVKSQTRKEVCWATSNIVAGTKEHVQHCIDCNLIPPLILSCQIQETIEVRREAGWALCNISKNGTSSQLDYIVGHGAIPPLIELLRCGDSQLVSIILQCLNYLLLILKRSLEVGIHRHHLTQLPSVILQSGGTDVIETLLQSDLQENSTVYSNCTSLLSSLNGDSIIID